MAKLKLLERQVAGMEKLQGNLCESIKNWMGVDPSRIPWDDDDFSIKRFRENFDTQISSKGKLREANAESAFGQLLRYGVQTFMFDAYKSVTDFIYTDIVTSRPSKNRQEWYAPMFGTEIPRDVPTGGKFADSRVAGLDIEVINKKVGRILTFERELVDDDQTGQIAQKAGDLGERMRYKEEADTMGVDVFTLVPFGNSTIASGAYGLVGLSGVSYSTTLFGTFNSTSYGNRPTSYATLSQTGLEYADIALHNATDPLSNRIMVRPSKLVVSPADKFNAAKLLNSTLQPSVPGTTLYGSSTTQTAQFTGGLTGWTMTVNPLQGLYDLKVSRFLPPGYWYLMDPRSIVFQDRDPLELLMEARDAGTSFERDEYRYRARRRYQVYVIDYRFIFCGNGI